MSGSLFVTLGRLGRPHGLDGELALHMAALDSAELLELREFRWRGLRGDTRALTLTDARPVLPRMLVRFAGVNSREAAAPLVNGDLQVERKRLPDPGPGVAWTFQLIGCQVRTVEGRALGALEGILPSGAHPIYVVKGEREWLIPVVENVVRNVDLKSGVITVALPAGLEDI
ncbi:MAG: ribosome maturation factor RimM [Candidatus Eiseniibacteriota bacterium]